MARESKALTQVSIACVILTACSSQSKPAAVAKESPAAEASAVSGSKDELKSVTRMSDIVLPIDAYIESPKQAHVNDSAVARLATDCMARLGYEWPYRESRIDESQSMNGGRYGVIEISTARKWGYHPPASSLDSPEGEKGERKNRSPREIEAYTGRLAKTGKPLEGKDGGCVGVAQSEVFGKGGLKPSLQYLLSYHENSFMVASKEAKVRRSMDGWSKCMKGFGHEYGDMWEVNNDRRWQETEEPSPLEKRIAEEDVTCKQTSKVLVVLLATETKLQSEYIAKHSSQFAEIQEYRSAVERRAQQVISSAGTKAG